MAIEWAKLRTLDGTQQRAFEELCCQLAAREAVPEGSKFTRKGTPDAGIEALWTVPDGDEHGWQAKFFQSSPDSGQWQQIDNSVRNALEKHPRLTKYIVCLPIDRPDARIEDQKSFLDRWKEHVETWKSWRTSGAPVEFVYWGAHEIWERLSREENRGRYRFWFDHELLTLEWLKARLAEAIKNVGPRYTPALNVDLPIARLFDGLSRTRSFYGRVEDGIAELRRKARFLRRPNSPKELLEDLGDQYDRFLRMTAQLGDARAEVLDWRGLGEAVTACSDAAGAAIDSLRASTEEESEDRESGSPGASAGDGRKLAEQRREREYELNGFRGAVREVVEMLDSQEVSLTNLPVLLIVGEAGTGKTHLLCDVAERWHTNRVPAIVLLGEHFTADEPWSQVVSLLRFSGDPEEFLGALNAAGELSGSRALLLIDAINEGEGRVLWPKYLAGFLETVRRYPWIGLALTIRSSYVEVAVPENLSGNDLVRVSHYGFASKEYEAVGQFFEFYGIELPSVPPLLPEFQNPLFLKLFCEGLKNEGLTRLPRGLQGITAIFRFYVDSLEKKLARELDIDPKGHAVQKAIDALSKEMSSRAASWLSREDAKSIVDNLVASTGFNRSLFNRLVSEGLLAEDLHFQSDPRKHIDIVRFGYERFSDHIIVSHLLQKHLDASQPEKSFEKEVALQRVIADEGTCALNRGLVEALSVQLPEVTGKELIEVAPSCREFWPVREAFVQSLIWRSQEKFFRATLDYVNSDIIRYRRTYDEFFDAVLTVAPIPDHPFNARLLDRNLRARSLPERDQSWSIWIHEQEGRRGGVDRLVDWSWHGGDKGHISDESVHLAAIAITWFLTSNNRRLRDRSTKALVALLENRLSILISLLDEFREADDPYLTERLFSVAYGCAMRSTDRPGTGKLAQRVYDLIFASGSPPPNLLLRDHARGIVELALAERAAISIDESKIRPPYGSEWPKHIPTQQELETFKEWSEGMPDVEWARVGLYNSVLGEGDFARYTVGTNSGLTRWSYLRLDDEQDPSRDHIENEFVNSLTGEQRELSRTYEEAKAKISDARRVALTRDKSSEKKAKVPEVEEAQRAAAEAKQQLMWRLNEPQRDLFRRIEGSAHGRVDLRFDLTLAQRFIFKRVLELGWTVDRFGRFDRELRRIHTGDRGEQVVERIGKKYQWIALYECFAKIADNFQWQKDSEGESYEGPWNPFYRNIDPSFLLAHSKRQDLPPYTRSWWFIVNYEHCPDEPDHRAWLRQGGDLPAVDPLLCVVDRVDKTEWLALDALYWWQQGKDEDEDYFSSPPRRSLYYMVRSYCVRNDDAERFLDWAAKQNFFGRWMPEPREVYHAYLGEFFWAPSVSGEYDPEGWETNEKTPCPVRVTSAGYLWEQGYDKSVDDGIRIALPARWISRQMNLKWRGVEGCFFDERERLVCFDPSIREQGPSALLFRRDALLEFLDSQSLTLVWTILGEKQVLSTDQDYPGWAAVSGAFGLRGDRVEGGLNYFPDIRGKSA